MKITFEIDFLTIPALCDLANAASKELDYWAGEGMKDDLPALRVKFESICDEIESRVRSGFDLGRAVPADWQISDHVVIPKALED